MAFMAGILCAVSYLGATPGSASKQYRLHRQHSLQYGFIVAFTGLKTDQGIDLQRETYHGSETLL